MDADHVIEHSYDFEAERLNASMLVGHQITLYSQQVPGKAIQSKVLSVSGDQVLIEGGSRFDVLENLVNNQSIVMQFQYRGERLAVKTTLKRSAGGRCYLMMDSRVTPLSQRRFRRYPIKRVTRLAAYPMMGFQRRDLNTLRWIETETINVSSGGALLTVPSVLEPDIHLLMNVDLQDFGFPQLVLGRVKHCLQLPDLHFHIGVEFIVRDQARRLFSPRQQNQLPPSLFVYTSTDRERLNRDLAHVHQN